jgi:FKBP-type peptidyl-prolyl cis-trans isomerase
LPGNHKEDAMTALARFALIALLAVGLVAVACSDDEDNGNGDAATSTPEVEAPGQDQGPPDVSGEPTVTDSGLQIIDIEVGGGDEAVAGGTVTVHYTLWLEDGTLIESSVGSDPVSFGLDGLIEAWQEGIPGMKEGGKRRLIAPPELGYGDAGSGNVPPNATLIFDISLLDTQ